MEGFYNHPLFLYRVRDKDMSIYSEVFSIEDLDLSSSFRISFKKNKPEPPSDTYTIVFTNTTYPQFDVYVPEDMIVEEGNSVELPSVEGTFEDSENSYTPQKWSIGDFGETITPTSNMTANLLWNVQQKIVTYTVSFVNTQLPDIQIDMPQSEIGEAGTTITLPTITGEYESGGKTYRPSSWDIGAFGSTYTITESIEAHLIFTEVEQYEEVTLYVTNGSKNVQPNVTSSYTGNINESYLYQLRNSSSSYDKFEYDYSKTYEVGYYDGGEWVGFPSSISELPSSTSDPEKTAYILHDSGKLWLCSNSSSPTPTPSGNTITVRVRRKSVQEYALYPDTSSLYDNGTFNYGRLILYGNPNLGSSGTAIPWGAPDVGFPVRTITRVLDAVGNEIDKSNINWVDSYSSGMVLQLNHTETFRTVLFTLDQPTYKGYITTNHLGRTSLDTSNPRNLMDEKGNAIPYEEGATYKVIGVFDRTDGFTGNCAAEGLWLINYISIVNNNGVAQATISSDFVWATYIWFTKTI